MTEDKDSHHLAVGQVQEALRRETPHISCLLIIDMRGICMDLKSSCAVMHENSNNLGLETSYRLPVT